MEGCNQNTVRFLTKNCTLVIVAKRPAEDDSGLVASGHLHPNMGER
jgi:hypothetical protein